MSEGKVWILKEFVDCGWSCFLGVHKKVHKNSETAGRRRRWESFRLATKFERLDIDSSPTHHTRTRP